MPASLRRVLVVVTVAALLAGCAQANPPASPPASPTPPPAAAAPIRIGAVFPISGDAAALALQELRGVQLALRRDIGTLQSRVRFIDIALVPAILTILAIVLGVARSRRRAAARATAVAGPHRT